MNGSVLVEEAWLPPGADHPSAPTLWAFDPATSRWSERLDLAPAAFDASGVTDGVSIATVQHTDQGLTILSVWREGGFSTSLRLPTTLWSDALPPIPMPSGDGYLLPLMTSLVIVGDDGTPQPVEPVPVGYVTLAPTNDPDRFLLTPAGNVTVSPGGLASGAGAGAPVSPGTAGVRVSLWDRTTGTVTFVMSGAESVHAAVSGLAMVRTMQGGWWRVASDVSATRLEPPGPGVSSLSPNGRRTVDASHVCADAPGIGTCQVLVRNARNGQLLATAPGPARELTWSGGTLAYVVIQGQDWHAAAIVVVRGGRVTQSLLP